MHLAHGARLGLRAHLDELRLRELAATRGRALSFPFRHAPPAGLETELKRLILDALRSDAGFPRSRDMSNIDIAWMVGEMSRGRRLGGRVAVATAWPRVLPCRLGCRGDGKVSCLTSIRAYEMAGRLVSPRGNESSVEALMSASATHYGHGNKHAKRASTCHHNGIKRRFPEESESPAPDPTL